MKTLLCDLNVYDNGHHIAFVNAILKYSKGREDIVFLFNQKAAYYCKGMNEDPRIFFLDEALLNPAGRPLVNKFREYRLIKKFALDHAIGRVMFLEIDQYQVAIGLSKPPFLITGIYFRPFHLIPTKGRSMIYYLKKRLMFEVLHLNRKVEPLFLLNDLAASTRYPSWFRYLPDPIFAGAAGATDGIRSRDNIPPSTHLFLAFGGMGYRKNIRNTLDAYLLAAFENDTTLLIAGKVRKEYREEFDSAVSDFLASNTDKRKRLVVWDKYVPEEQLDAYFEEADTILLCYVKFYGSSGLMGKAAQHRKTCIIPDRGLMDELNREYGIGYSADPTNVQSIASALSRAKQEPLPEAGFQRFVRDHHESAFLNTLLTT